MVLDSERKQKKNYTPENRWGNCTAIEHSGTRKSSSQRICHDPHTQTSWRERASNTFTTSDSLRKSKCLWGLQKTFNSGAVASIITEGFTNCCGNSSAQDHRALQTGDLYNSGCRARAMKDPHHPVKHFSSHKFNRERLRKSFSPWAIER